MYQPAAKLKWFFSQFGMKAYAENNVPKNEPLPYITYPLKEPAWNIQTNTYCQIWYPKNDLEDLLHKADEVVAAIGAAGVKIQMDGGYILLYLPDGDQIQTIQDDFTERAYISLVMNVYHMPGA